MPITAQARSALPSDAGKRVSRRSADRPWTVALRLSLPRGRSTGAAEGNRRIERTTSLDSGSLPVSVPRELLRAKPGLRSSQLRPPSAVGRDRPLLRHGVPSLRGDVSRLEWRCGGLLGQRYRVVGTFGSSGTWKFCAPLPEGRAIGFSGTATDPICLAGRFVGPRRSTFRPGINPGFDTVLTPHAVVELVLASILALWGNASSPTVLAEDFSKLRSVRTGQLCQRRPLAPTSAIPSDRWTSDQSWSRAFPARLGCPGQGPQT